MLVGGEWVCTLSDDLMWGLSAMRTPLQGSSVSNMMVVCVICKVPLLKNIVKGKAVTGEREMPGRRVHHPVELA